MGAEILWTAKDEARQEATRGRILRRQRERAAFEAYAAQMIRRLDFEQDLRGDEAKARRCAFDWIEDWWNESVVAEEG